MWLWCWLSLRDCEVHAHGGLGDVEREQRHDVEDEVEEDGVQENHSAMQERQGWQGKNNK